MAKEDNGNLERLITDLTESLKREIGLLREETRSGFERLEIRLDDMGTRLDRHAGLLQTGSRWTVRANRWAERIDRAMEKKNRQIADLDRRLKALEDKQQS